MPSCMLQQPCSPDSRAEQKEANRTREYRDVQRSDRAKLTDTELQHVQKAARSVCLPRLTAASVDSVPVPNDSPRDDQNETRYRGDP